MTKIIHIGLSEKEIDDIFSEAMRNLDHLLELFASIEYQDSGAKFMAKKAYKLLLQGEEIQKGWIPND